MLNSPHSSDPSFTEATVLSVDPIRFTCSAKTTTGKILTEVSWLIPTGGLSETGLSVTPNINDKVLLVTSLGYPLIIGCIPRIGSYNGQVASMMGSNPTKDLGYDSVLGTTTTNPSKPNDYHPGDLVYTARGGAFLGVLSGGIAMLRAGPMAQLVMSKFEGLLRLVTRNYQRFSDSSSRVATNMKGRLYEYFAVDWDITRGQVGQERYQEAFGDVAAAEVLKAAPDHTIALPIVDTRRKRKWLTDATGAVLYTETLKEDGSLTLIVENAAATATSTTTINNAEWQEQVIGSGNTATITITPTNILINYNNVAEATFNATEVFLNYNNVSEVTLNASEAQVNFNNVAKTTLTSSSAIVDFNGTSTVTLNGSEASMTSGGHFCNVTSSGVALG